VTLINRSENFRADEITVEKIKQNPKFKAVTSVTMKEVTGDKFVSGLTIVHQDGTEETLPVSGIFVEIGQISNGTFLKDIVEVDATGKVVIDPWTQRTSTDGTGLQETSPIFTITRTISLPETE
jgi:thioredoxin reductase